MLDEKLVDTLINEYLEKEFIIASVVFSRNTNKKIAYIPKTKIFSVSGENRNGIILNFTTNSKEVAIRAYNNFKL